MTHPVFDKELFIETAFERRFQAMLRSAWQKRLSPRNGVLRFPSHDKRKTRTPNTEQRWAMEKTIWEVVGGERK